MPDAVLALYLAYAHQQGKPRAGDKTPFHLLHIERLADAFPEARFVHIVRDGRDVVPSILGMSFGPDRFAEAVLFWQRRVEQGLDGGAALGPERYQEIRYEAMVTDPEAALRDLCPFIGLEYSDEMLRYHERAERPPRRVSRDPPRPRGPTPTHRRRA